MCCFSAGVLDFSEDGLRVVAGAPRRPPQGKQAEKNPDTLRRIFSAHKKVRSKTWLGRLPPGFPTWCVSSLIRDKQEVMAAGPVGSGPSTYTQDDSARSVCVGPAEEPPLLLFVYQPANGLMLCSSPAVLV